eukprot:2174445-Pleurochrysis_carterae.AAC.1
MYVWIDALSNYISALGYPDGEAFRAFWPAAVHVIGKDITWFHCVIWPALLMSLELPLPTTVLAHGFVHGADGRKMSKSLGNVVDPLEVLAKFDLDSFRYFVVRDAPLGGDLTFSEDALAIRHNAELIGTFGNLVNRALALCEKYCAGCVPAAKADRVLDIDALREATERAYGSFALHSAMEMAIGAFGTVNKYVTDTEPWHMKADDPKRNVVVRTLLEHVYALTHFVQPVLVRGASAVFSKLNTPPVAICALKTSLDCLNVGTRVSAGGVLYQQAQTEEAFARMEAEAAAKKVAAAKGAAKAAAKSGAKVEDQSDLSRLDLRVGRVLSVRKHTEADALYVEEIDLGEPKPRVVVSGLVAHMPADSLQNALVVCLANTKPSKMRGVESQAMLLCGFAADGGAVRLVRPPDGCVPGDRVHFDGHEGEPEKQLNPKKKLWDKLQGDLNVHKRVPRYKELPFMTEKGTCRVDDIDAGSIK